MPFKFSPRAGLLALAVAFAAPAALASHSWGGYHWARTANPMTLKIGNNTTTVAWDTAFGISMVDWSASTVLDVVEVAGAANPKNCRPTAGRVEVCNSRYGNTNWLGIASIWLSGGHIGQGTVKLNDTYFNTNKYNTPAWRNLVMCQEIGHTFGLDHQDENFSNGNLGTCMDYTNNPESNQHPNAHDYDMLESIYGHLDSTNSFSAATVNNGADIDTNDPRNWGQLVKVSNGGRTAIYELNLGGGRKIVTFVIWADEPQGNRVR
jgi:hypothetical protein